MYHSASEVVREGLRLLKVQDDVREYRINQLREDIAIGAEQIERGQYTDYDVDNIQSLVEEIQTEGRRRLEIRTAAKCR
jgi:antitoxin ParD1/3/4